MSRVGGTPPRARVGESSESRGSRKLRRSTGPLGPDRGGSPPHTRSSPLLSTTVNGLLAAHGGEARRPGAALLLDRVEAGAAIDVVLGAAAYDAYEVVARTAVEPIYADVTEYSIVACDAQ